ncbi:putative NADH:ubiquinone oxidoreductase, subunit RnfD [Fervidobacterium pennivorans DSM 9078]|jgi:Na+-transporting NADH:ubiquinone oxidoreductase subunit B|uniref:NADH:ubiquinone oxidoreductase, subunit RnfD n=1 Tax=Fervidobacterium pennivorans (strain DSM 9078 / Ven5) TaxID=771875 RepID=H9UBX5_FERPD|nr:RnfABCDGE type electron transport complex subunit D [Fervidobacterium pennivorans]AFG35018.1 putative NADH:ubiquinone oxidoreductase, subunit RnfD [Fervidobacterium pennivorans DSM 9078]QIV78091.1 RnfABCDGE type electron transport complex subunit D [Fervidobacterium pennivorans subsp. keratinolyticus]
MGFTGPIKFQKQPMMRKMLYALTPILMFSIFAYGLRVIWLGFWVLLTAIFVEYLFEKRKNKPVSEAVLVTAMLFLLSLPPSVPFWVAIIGIAFGVAFGKEVYGGFSRNVFNPAIVGRLFIYITFPLYMTSGWFKPSLFGLDAATSATPLQILRDGQNVDLLNLLLGWRAGAMGEAPVLLILLAAIYLIWTKTANWRLMISTYGSAVLLTFLLDLFNVPKSLPTIPAMLSGSLLFITVFMATEPITAPKKIKSMWIYGIIIGLSGVVIRTFSLFSEGWSFAILIGNMFAPLLDEIIKDKKVKKPVKSVNNDASEKKVEA